MAPPTSSKTPAYTDSHSVRLIVASNQTLKHGPSDEMSEYAKHYIAVALFSDERVSYNKTQVLTIAF